jgi:exonuclease III
VAPTGRRPLERLRHRWEDNIKMDVRGVGCGDMNWMDLAQDMNRWRALVNAVMNLHVPQNAGNFLTS